MSGRNWPTILIATTNPGKLREIEAVLAGLPVAFKTLADVDPIPEPEETGTTFGENACIKALAYAAAARLPTVAEDSGLSIDALGGRPGVLSARYPGATYADKFAGLYRELAGHPQPWRAYFTAALAVAEPTADGATIAVEFLRRVPGTIVDAPRGTNGFGYDPIFAYASGRTGGELTADEKQRVSHRGGVFRQFRRWLEMGVEAIC